MAHPDSFFQGYVTIKSLINRSGAPRQTIHYYLRKGLLPAPERTSRTSALYSPSTIDLLGLIRSLQQRQRLTLDEIAEVFRHSNYDPVRIAARTNGSSEPPSTSSRRDYLPAADLAAAIGAPCTQEWVQEQAQNGLLKPVWRDGRELFPSSLVEVARAVWDGARVGIDAEVFKTWGLLAESEADKKIAPLQQALEKMPPAAPSLVAAAFDVFERFVRARRRNALSAALVRSSMRHHHLFLGPDWKYLFPSETLLVKMGLNREIDRLSRILDRHRDNLDALKALRRAHTMRSDWVHVQQTAREILRLDPDNVTALSDLAQSFRYQERPQDAVALLQPVLEKQNHPLLKLRLASALVSKARETGDIRQMVEAVEEYQRLAGEALCESQADRVLNRRIRLVIALEAMSLTGPLGIPRPSVDEIQRLYDEYQLVKESRLSLLSRISLARGKIFLTYALYLFRQREGHRDAERLRRELLKADPHGVFAERVKPVERQRETPGASHSKSTKRKPSLAKRKHR